MRNRNTFHVREVGGVMHGTCNKCGEEKALTEFHSDKSKRYGVHTSCKRCRCKYKDFPVTKSCPTCKKDFEITCGSQMPRKYCSSECAPTRFKYNITRKHYEDKKIAQGNRCLICGEKQDKKMAVDHCHATNKLRDLLCSACNTSLGFFKEDVQAIDNACEYVLKHRGILFNRLVEEVENLIGFENESVEKF